MKDSREMKKQNILNMRVTSDYAEYNFQREHAGMQQWMKTGYRNDQNNRYKKKYYNFIAENEKE